MKSKNNKCTTKSKLLINFTNFKITNWLIVSFIFFTFCITYQQALAVTDDTTAGGDRPIADVITEFQSSPETMEASELMFNQNCAYCHGNKGAGGKSRKMQCLRFLNNEYVFKTITNGKRSGSLIMPSWSRSFDKTKRLMLTAYVMSLKTLPQCSK